MIKKILVLLIILGAPIQHYASAEGAPMDANIGPAISPGAVVANPATICEETYPDHGPEFGECVNNGRSARAHR